jgi:hypothetical protein
MPRHTLVLTETADGIRDHGNHLRRREKAVRRAQRDFNITVLGITDSQVGSAGVYTWKVDDPNGNVDALIRLFNNFGFVHCPGPIREFSEQEELRIQDLIAKSRAAEKD